MTTLDAQSSTHEDAGTATITDDGSLTPAPPRLPREDAAPGTAGTPDALPGPDGTHEGWDATTVSTAKCDMCHKQRCGTIQKCSECKLSVCIDCAVADRLRGDARHALNPAAVDWMGPPVLSRLQRLKASRSRIGGVRHAAARLVRAQQIRGRKSMAQLRLVPSRATSTSFSSSASPLTDISSSAFLDDDDDEGGNKDAWGEGYGRWADEGGGQQGLQPVDEAAVGTATAAEGIYHQPVTRVAKATSLLSARTAQTKDAAEILAQMPCRHPWSAAEQQQQDTRPYGSASVLLPPVRSNPDPQQSSHLPPLRTLHPLLGVENAPLQPLMVGNRGPMLPHPASSWTYTGHWGNPNDMRQGSSFDHHRTQGCLSWDAQQQQQPQHSHALQYAPIVDAYCNENHGSHLNKTLSAASTAQHAPHEQQSTAAQATNSGAPYTDYAYVSYLPQRNGGRSPSYEPPPPGYPPAAITPTGAEAYEPPTAPATRFPGPTVQEQGIALKSSTLAIQAVEHPDWPLDWCLQLALARTWAQRRGEEPRAFLELRAAAYAAVLALDLPERHNAARVWLSQLQISLGS